MASGDHGIDRKDFFSSNGTGGSESNGTGQNGNRDVEIGTSGSENRDKGIARQFVESDKESEKGKSFFDPNIVGEPEKRRRGRPPGSKNRTTQTGKGNVLLEPKDLGQKIVGVHKIAAVMTGLQEIAISDVEGEQLAKAVIELTRYYNFAPQGPLVAWINLAGVAGMIYVPRLVVIGAKKAKAKKAKRENVPSNEAMPEGMNSGSMQSVSADLTNPYNYKIKWPTEMQ